MHIEHIEGELEPFLKWLREKSVKGQLQLTPNRGWMYWDKGDWNTHLTDAMVLGIYLREKGD